VLNVARPEDDWNREGEAQPKLVTKHCHRVTGVVIVTPAGLGDAVTCFLVAHVRVILIRRVIHLGLSHTHELELQ